MSISKLKGATVEAHLWAKVEEVESQALDQLRNIASLPWVAHVAVMPDVHFGKGATVGSVIGMRGAVSPAAVGVDIGCGMGAIKTSLKAKDLPDSHHELRLAIEQAVPVGFNSHDSVIFKRPNVPFQLRTACEKLMEEFDGLTERVHDNLSRAAHQLGTMGGGNHFI